MYSYKSHGYWFGYKQAFFSKTKCRPDGHLKTWATSLLHAMKLTHSNGCLMFPSSLPIQASRTKKKYKNVLQANSYVNNHPSLTTHTELLHH